MLSKLLVVTASVAIAAGIVVGVRGSFLGGDPSNLPVGTPAPRTPSPDERANAPTEGELIPLNEPVPFPIPLSVGGKTIMMPTGSVLKETLNEPGVIPLPSDFHFEVVTVTRGRSKVSFDGDTGEILVWDVASEDREDFEALRPK